MQPINQDRRPTWQKFSDIDDLIAFLLVDCIYLDFNTRKINTTDPNSYWKRLTHSSVDQTIITNFTVNVINSIVNMKGCSLAKSISVATDVLMEFFSHAYHYIPTNKKKATTHVLEDIFQNLAGEELEYIRNQIRCYLCMYRHDAGFEIRKTDQFAKKNNNNDDDAENDNDTVYIHDAGLFATKAWRKDEWMLCCFGTLFGLNTTNITNTTTNTTTTENNTLIPEESIIYSSKTHRTSMLLGIIRFVNHDCQQHNIEFFPFNGNCWISAKITKDIDVGEEITGFYSDHYFGFQNKDCLCKSCKNRDSRIDDDLMMRDVAVEENIYRFRQTKERMRTKISVNDIINNIDMEEETDHENETKKQKTTCKKCKFKSDNDLCCNCMRHRMIFDYCDWPERPESEKSWRKYWRTKSTAEIVMELVQEDNTSSAKKVTPLISEDFTFFFEHI